MSGELRRMVLMGGFSRFGEGKVSGAENSCFQGVFAKMMSKHRVFDGEFVVRCVVNVVLLTARFGS
jgi:hypothetical protein